MPQRRLMVVLCHGAFVLEHTDQPCAFMLELADQAFSPLVTISFNWSAPMVFIPPAQRLCHSRLLSCCHHCIFCSFMLIGATWQCHCHGRHCPEQCATGFAVNRFRQEVTDVARCRYFLDHQVACCSHFWDPQGSVSD